jgi:hypothetical protein
MNQNFVFSLTLLIDRLNFLRLYLKIEFGLALFWGKTSYESKSCCFTFLETSMILFHIRIMRYHQTSTID